MKIPLNDDVLAAVQGYDGPMTGSMIAQEDAKAVAKGIVIMLQHLGNARPPACLAAYVRSGAIVLPNLQDELMQIVSDYRLAEDEDDLLAVNALIAEVNYQGERDGCLSWRLV